MLNDQQELLIERYFRQELSEAERQEFDTLISTDPEFKETVENQSVLQEGLQILALEKEIKSYMQELNEEDAKVVPLWKSPVFIGIAASFLLLVVFTSYAGYKLGWFKGWFENEKQPQQQKEIIVPEDTIGTENPASGKSIPSFNNYSQLIYIHTADVTDIEGGLGTLFRFPQASLFDESDLTILDSVHVELIEILNPNEIKILTEGTVLENKMVIKVFYLLPYYSQGPIRMSSLAPPRLVLPKEQKANLFYGGDERMLINWKAASDLSEILIKEPTAEMELYKRFVEGKIFLDSLEKNYYLHKDFYVRNDGRGMEFSKTYVHRVRYLVNSYANDTNFSRNVLNAQSQWRVYNEQHSLEINRRRDGVENSKPLYKPGWYAVVKNE